jgi:NAD(P)H-nitrite reductase large subunit
VSEKQFGGIHKRPDGTFSVTPRMPLGKLDVDALETIIGIIKKFNLPGIRSTTDQRLTLDGIPAGAVDDVVKLLNGVGNPYPQSIVACRGQGDCEHGLQNTQAMAKQVEDIFIHLLHIPTHLKIGISGCSRCCGNSYIRDIGLVGTPNGWTLAIGGKSGSKVRCADDLLVDLPWEQVLTTLKLFLTFYKENMREKERIAPFVERLGIDHIRSELQI